MAQLSVRAMLRAIAKERGPEATRAGIGVSATRASSTAFFPRGTRSGDAIKGFTEKSQREIKLG